MGRSVSVQEVGESDERQTLLILERQLMSSFFGWAAAVAECGDERGRGERETNGRGCEEGGQSQTD